MEARELLLGLALKYEGDWDLIMLALNKKETEGLEEYVKSYKGNFITILDENYPQSLKNCYKPPFVLFYKGDINLLKDTENTYCITGTRNPALKTFNQVEKIYNDYKDKLLINNLSLGVNTYALMNNKKAIIVLAGGLDNIYPHQNEKLLKEKIYSGSLVITEYPNNVFPKASTFADRQRIIASLSNELIMVDCYKKSGGHTLGLIMLQLGKDVKCVPDTDNKDSICNEFIEQGAQAVFKWCW